MECLKKKLNLVNILNKFLYIFEFCKFFRNFINSRTPHTYIKFQLFESLKGIIVNISIIIGK